VTGNVYFAETFESEADFMYRSDSFINLLKCTVQLSVPLALFHVHFIINHRRT